MNGSLTLELKDLSRYVCMTKYSATQEDTSSKCDISKMEKDLTELAQSSLINLLCPAVQKSYLTQTELY